MNRSFKIICFISGLAVIFLDQLSKYIIQAKIPAQGIFLVNGNSLNIALAPVSNASLAFGLKVAPFFTNILFILVLGLLILWAISLYKKNERKNLLLLTLIAGAAISNFIDRIRMGGVYDFISISFDNFYWPTFNFADTIITISVLYLLIKTIKNNSANSGIKKTL
ncbi:MAG: signal peptidase II [Patescibacteria group bacterium]